MRRLLPGLLAILLLAAITPAQALDGLTGRAGLADPPPGDISANLTYLGTISHGGGQVISLNVIGDTMFASTVTGIYSYDISEPTTPVLLGVLPMYIWQNEDMDVDLERELLFISRDPRGFTGQAAPAALRLFGAVHIIDVSDPTLMTQVGFITLPAGHTSTCISADAEDLDACDYLWTGGPYANDLLGPAGRPIYATDVTDPANPVTCPEPINAGLMPDGGTGYAHDVQVDETGVAWVSSETGIHGYWTSGEHHNPLTGAVETATPCDPVPYGGATSPTEATPSRFMHNSDRNLALSIPGDQTSVGAGAVVVATEEAITSSCASSGRAVTYDIRSTLDGRGFSDPANAELDVLDTWTPEGVEGGDGCASAHYFEDRGDGLLAWGFFGQGTRLLDVSDPTDIRQVGYFRPDDANTWGAYWHDDLIYVADNGRGIDILRLDGAGSAGSAGSGGAGSGVAAAAAPSAMVEVAAPAMPAAQWAAWASRVTPDPVTGYLCPLT